MNIHTAILTQIAQDTNSTIATQHPYNPYQDTLTPPHTYHLTHNNKTQAQITLQDNQITITILHTNTTIHQDITNPTYNPQYNWLKTLLDQNP